MPITSINNTVSQKPSIVDAIIKQGVASAPLLSMLKSGSISAPEHSWINDRYRDGEDNAQKEVSDLVDGKDPTKVKNKNVAQIITNHIQLSKRQVEMSHYGEKELPYQVAKVGKEHLKDIEFALLGLGHTGGDVFKAPVAGTNTVAPRMAGLFYFVPSEHSLVPTGVTVGTPASYKELTMDILHEMIEPMWKRGATDDETFEVLLGSVLKQRINNIAKDYIIKKSGEHKFDPTVTEIVTDFGTLKFRLHRLFAGDALKDKILCGKFNEASLMYVTKTELKDVPTSKTLVAKRYYTDLTLEVKNGDMFSCAQGLK